MCLPQFSGVLAALVVLRLGLSYSLKQRDSNYTVGFARGSGGCGGSTIDYWNFTYSLPQGYSSDDNGPAWIALGAYEDGSLQAS
jgi:hypothetical protein